MATRMMLELRYINSTEVTIHLDAKLMRHGGTGSYISPDWARENAQDSDPFTEVGSKLLESLATLSGVSVMYGGYGMMVRVPEVFDIQDVLWDVLQKVRDVLEDDIQFATTLGDDAFTKPEFITNPDREAFEDNINTMLAELRQRNSQAVVEAERTIERLSETIAQARSRR